MRILDESLLIEIGEYIKQYQAMNGSSPTRRDIAEQFKITLPRVQRYIYALRSRETIDLNRDGKITLPYQFDSSEQRIVPLLGAVKCGEPTLAIEEYDGMFKLPREFTGTGTFFMLIAKGDSMINAGINEGDYLVIREQETAQHGDIVVACRVSEFSADEEATLKRYKFENGKYIMHPENEAYEDMDANEFRIIGKA